MKEKPIIETDKTSVTPAQLYGLKGLKSEYKSK